MAGMFVCLPKVSGKNGFGLEVLNPCIQFLVPKPFSKVEVQRTGVALLFDDARRAHDTVLLVLSLPCLNLLCKLVDGIQGIMELGTLKIVAFKIGPSEMVPSAVMGDFEMRLLGERPEAIVPIEQAPF